MGRVRSVARGITLRAAAAARAVRRRIHLALGGPGSMEIVAYRGYGSADRLHVRGRVLADKGLRAGRADDRPWENLRNMRKRLLSRPIPRARLVATFQGRAHPVTTDDLGYFDLWIRPAAPLAPGRTWVEVPLELVAPLDRRQGVVRATAQVRVPGPRTRFVVVSDMDDTVVRTGATSVLSLLRESFTGNAYTRVPFPGVAALYRALRDGAAGDEENPLLFVSRSPWNLYDLFDQFLRLHEIDERPVIFLRRWGLTEEGLTLADVKGLKYTLISQMLELHAGLPFILVGDSGQKDPEIYREVIRAYPDRVLAVYVRSVSRHAARAEAVRALAREVAAQGSTLILAADSVEMARHAARNGWIDPSTVSAVAGERAIEREAGARVDERPARRVGGADAAGTEAALDDGALDRALEKAERERAPVVVETERRDHPAR